MSDQFTHLNEVGEFKLIQKLTENFSTYHSSSIKGIGDDAAVIDAGDHCKVISTDALVEGIHFNLMYVPLKHLGYKAVVVNLSDIYAMNAQPEQITVSIAISSKFPLEAVEELYAGIKKACDVYKVDLVGGDTTSSYSGLMISITAIGRGEKDKIVYRSGAKENDLLVVSGDLGGAFVGLQVLERERSLYKENPEMQPDLSGHDYILERQLKPEARKDVIEGLAQLEIQPTSMIDISDGLASEVLHICHESNVGCNVYDEKIPIDPDTYNTAREFHLDPSTCALNGGEDYELLFTIDQSDFDKIKGNPHFTVIGHMTKNNGEAYIVNKNSALLPIKAQGWEHFNRDED